MPKPSTAPAPLNRPAFAHYLWERDVDFREAAEALGRSREWVRLVCLPFNDPRRRIPNCDDMAVIHAWTGGEIGPPSFYPPSLNQRSVAGADGAVEA
jgi:hypothetical protein